jgi:hypothetical protein
MFAGRHDDESQNHDPQLQGELRVCASDKITGTPYYLHQVRSFSKILNKIKFRSGQVKSGQVRSSQVMSRQVKSHHITSLYVTWRQVTKHEAVQIRKYDQRVGEEATKPSLSRSRTCIDSPIVESTLSSSPSRRARILDTLLLSRSCPTASTNSPGRATYTRMAHSPNDSSVGMMTDTGI